MRKIYCVLIVILFLISGCQSSNSSADWAYSFIVFNGNIYVVSDNKISDDQLAEQVGKIDAYSENEVDVDINKSFSNKFPVGSKVFKIAEKDETTLAVKTQDSNVEVTFKSKYGK